MDPQRRNYVHNIPAARALRDRQTPTEAVMWQALRGRRAGGWKFRRQHAVGRFVLDFYCHALRLAVEIDGGIHNSAEQTALDHERREVGQALSSRQATETVERTGREHAARGRELATQSLLDEIAA